jgi:hypothetical protein
MLEEEAADMSMKIYDLYTVNEAELQKAYYSEIAELYESYYCDTNPYAQSVGVDLHK